MGTYLKRPSKAYSNPVYDTRHRIHEHFTSHVVRHNATTAAAEKYTFHTTMNST